MKKREATGLARDHEFKYVDADELASGDESFDFRMIVLQTIRDVERKVSSEFREGYTQETKTSAGTRIAYVPDNRQEYIQLIEFLYDLIYPYYTSDELKPIREIEEEIGEKKKELFPEGKYLSDGIEYKEYIIFYLQKMREMFREISKLLKENNYFAEGGIME